MEDLSAVLGSQLNQFDLSSLNIDGTLSFSDLAYQAVNGQLDLSLASVMNTFSQQFFSEVLVHAHLIRQLLIVAVLSAVLKCLTDAFSHKSAGELGFYAVYMAMVLMVFSSFQLAVGILSEMVGSITGMMEASVPLIISLLAISGNFAGAAVFHPVLIFAAQLIARFISEIFIPLVLAAAVLQIVNHLAEGDRLGRFTSLIKKGVDLTLKGIVTLFALLLTLQKISVPIINNVAMKTAKAAANAVPVVGGALNSALDTVAYWSSAVKSGVLVALIIVICVSVAVPLVKILALMLIFKLAAALAQPICDERVIGCIDSIGTYMGLLLNAGILTAVMFVYSVVILLLW